MKLRHPRTRRQLTPRQSELLTLARGGAVVVVLVGEWRSRSVQCCGQWFARHTWRPLENLFNHPTLITANNRTYASAYTLNQLYKE